MAFRPLRLIQLHTKKLFDILMLTFLKSLLKSFKIFTALLLTFKLNILNYLFLPKSFERIPTLSFHSAPDFISQTGASRLVHPPVDVCCFIWLGKVRRPTTILPQKDWHGIRRIFKYGGISRFGDLMRWKMLMFVNKLAYSLIECIDLTNIWKIEQKPLKNLYILALFMKLPCYIFNSSLYSTSIYK